MSFDQLSSMERQPTTMRREDDPVYSDDPEFQQLTQRLFAQLSSLTSDVTTLSNQVALLGTKRDNDRVRERVHDLLESTRDTFKEVADGVKRAQSWEDVNRSQEYIQRKLSSEFKASLEEFQTVQRRALERQRASTVAARTALDEQGGPESPSQGQQVGGQQEQEQLRVASQDEVDFQESLIVERESEIRNIEQSVGELNELFRDVAHMVNDQGEQLLGIDQVVTGVRDDTQGADRELRSAHRYQKNARNKACCLLLILAIVLTIVLLAVFLG
ncbi:MAG: hypothetical protein M4579_001219 [Chaenotheca gracillima]|nr:MAG: hypothetical protein M4579_001219 [Chaenotheca gracillima]